MCMFRCSKFLHAWLFLFVYLLFVSYGRRLVGLCILLNWLTERNCSMFRDVQKKKRDKKKHGMTPFPGSFAQRSNLTALGSLTRRSNPQWLSSYLFIKNLSIDHERLLQGNISYGLRKQLLHDNCWHRTRILSTENKTARPKIWYMTQSVIQSTWKKQRNGSRNKCELF